MKIQAKTNVARILTETEANAVSGGGVRASGALVVAQGALNVAKVGAEIMGAIQKAVGQSTAPDPWG